MTTDSSIDLKLGVELTEEIIKDRVLNPQEIKGEDMNYNAIIALATNDSYYLRRNNERAKDIINRNISFVLFLDIDIDELERYIVEILDDPGLTKKQKMYIQKGFHLLCP